MDFGNHLALLPESLLCAPSTEIILVFSKL